ncbi:hypothetical protein PIB30_057694 [Stylosanthes scabra]|uniref:Uncharacterized protein n=1 Tax=Stylosanthes scabra TaxID=79078 RepID=A0ABU6VJB7_9FABA|nr:hypothetical protein [Stylosanthes scabra]
MKMMNTETSGGDSGRVRRRIETRFGPLESSRREEDNHGGGEARKQSEENKKLMNTMKKKIGKKLQPAKKAWRSFSKAVQSRVNKHNIQKSIKNTLHRLITTFHYLCHLITRRRSHRRPLTTTRTPYSASYHGRSIPAIHIDDLFAESASASTSTSAMNIRVRGNNNTTSATRARGEASRGKEVVVDKKELQGDIDTLEDAWKVVVAKSPMLQVDQKAEEFISKFHLDMKIQKEKSLLEFQEMLARSV